MTRGSFSVACTGPVARFGVGHHRAKLQRVEHAAVQADARLAEEHRAAVLELDRQRRSRTQSGADTSSPTPASDAVERPLDHAARASAADPREQVVVRLDRDACGRTAAPRAGRAAPISRVIAGSSYSVAIASASAAGIAGRGDQAAAALARDLRRLAARIGGGDVRPARREDAVDLARHDEAFDAWP